MASYLSQPFLHNYHPPSASPPTSIGRRRNKANAIKEPTSFAGKAEADVIVIGSGIGGLCCAGLLARYENDVIVLESHDVPGGAAHSFDIQGYKFDSGPSLFSGFQSRGPQPNPLAQVLDVLGESVPCVSYDSWKLYMPEGEFLSRFDPTEFYKKGKKGKPLMALVLREREFYKCLGTWIDHLTPRNHSVPNLNHVSQILRRSCRSVSPSAIPFTLPNT